MDRQQATEREKVKNERYVQGEGTWSDVDGKKREKKKKPEVELFCRSSRRLFDMPQKGNKQRAKQRKRRHLTMLVPILFSSSRTSTTRKSS